MKEIILASDNKNKIKELRELLKEEDIKIISKSEAGYDDIVILENGDTLEENALIKARILHKLSNKMVIADDSGLFIDALDGAPGVKSARYAGVDANSKKNNEKLLMELENKVRGAEFKCALALITREGQEFIVTGECRGQILKDYKGADGFGYDPLFLPDGYDITFAEMSIDKKNTISHRGIALNNLKKLIKELK